MPAPDFPTLIDGPLRDMVGGGPHRVQPGQVTDDTQMAACLAASLVAVEAFSPEDVSQRYRAWKPHAFDIGTQTAQVLDAMPGMGWERAAREHWLQTGRKPAGNGSLMRTAPIGVYFADDAEARLRASLGDSALTHFDPRCQLACAALNGAIAQAVTATGVLKPDALVSAAERATSLGAATLAKREPTIVAEIQEAARCVREDLAFAKKTDPELYGPELRFFDMQGFVRIAFRLAFWELLHAPTFEAALVDVVNRGADSDTNGAITGALLGAFHGDEQIPGRWRGPVMAALEGKRTPLADAYHPRQLLRLIEDDL
jgi:ADP-ribosylglycohydrolase